MVLTALPRSAGADVVTEDARFMGVDAAHAPSGWGSDELQLVGALGFPFARYPTGEPLRVRLWLGATPGAGRALLLELTPWPGRDRGGNAGARTPSSCSLTWTGRRSAIATRSRV